MLIVVRNTPPAKTRSSSTRCTAPLSTLWPFVVEPSAHDCALTRSHNRQADSPTLVRWGDSRGSQVSRAEPGLDKPMPGRPTSRRGAAAAPSPLYFHRVASQVQACLRAVAPIRVTHARPVGLDLTPVGKRFESSGSRSRVEDMALVAVTTSARGCCPLSAAADRGESRRFDATARCPSAQQMSTPNESDSDARLRTLVTLPDCVRPRLP